MDIPVQDFNPFGSVEHYFVREAIISRTNVNPARMFKRGLTPTFSSFLLRDRQSLIDPAWSSRFGLQNLT